MPLFGIFQFQAKFMMKTWSSKLHADLGPYATDSYIHFILVICFDFYANLFIVTCDDLARSHFSRGRKLNCWNSPCCPPFLLNETFLHYSFIKVVLGK